MDIKLVLICRKRLSQIQQNNLSNQLICPQAFQPSSTNAGKMNHVTTQTSSCLPSTPISLQRIPPYPKKSQVAVPLLQLVPGDGDWQTC